MMAVYPERVLDPHDPMVTATLDSTRAKYAEGVMTYGDGYWLHDYLTMKNTETEVIRGDQQLALERAVRRAAPHQLHARRLRVRRAPVGRRATSATTWRRTAGSRPAIARCCATCWCARRATRCTSSRCSRPRGSGRETAWWCASAPTDFGPGRLPARRGGGHRRRRSRWTPRFARPPAAVVVHLPWFVDARRAEADGRRRAASGVASCVLAPTTRTVAAAVGPSPRRAGAELRRDGAELPAGVPAALGGLAARWQVRGRQGRHEDDNPAFLKG